MKILLTGACGLVGRAIMKAGRGAHTFVPIDIVDQVESVGGHRISVTDRDAILRVSEGCDAIIHTAALHGHFYGKKPNQEFIEVNVVGAENLFEAAIKHGIRRCVFSSTLEVVCGIDWMANGVAVYDRYTPPRPDWIYPVTKLMVEQLGQYHVREHGLEVVQLRYSYVRDLPMEQIGLGLLSHSVADSDVASANLLAATKPGLKDEALMVAAEVPFTIKDVMAAQKDPWAVLEKYWPGCSDVLRRHNLTPKPRDFWPIAKVDDTKIVLGWESKANFTAFLQYLGWTGQPQPVPIAMLDNR